MTANVGMIRRVAVESKRNQERVVFKARPFIARSTRSARVGGCFHPIEERTENQEPMEAAMKSHALAVMTHLWTM